MRRPLSRGMRTFSNIDAIATTVRCDTFMKEKHPCQDGSSQGHRPGRGSTPWLAVPSKALVGAVRLPRTLVGVNVSNGIEPCRAVVPLDC